MTLASSSGGAGRALGIAGMSNEEGTESEKAPSSDPPLGTGARIGVGIVVAAIVGTTLYFMFQKTPDDVIEERRAAAKAKIQEIEMVIADARSLAPLTEDTLRAPDERVEIGGDSPNGTLIATVRLDAPPFGAEMFVPCFRSSPLHEEIQTHLNGAGLTSTVAKANALFDRFDRIRYAVVVIERVCTAPTVSADAQTFTPGFVSGEAHLFELQGRRHLGGVRFHAANVKESLTAMLWKGNGHSRREDVAATVRADLMMEAYGSLAPLLGPKQIALSSLPD